jgi:hypothetical protein
MVDILRPRVFAIACGYPDANDLLGAHGNGSTIADGSGPNRCAGICDLLRCKRAFFGAGVASACAEVSL